MDERTDQTPPSTATPPPEQATEPESSSSSLSTAVVGAGIFLSRISGLVRERIFAQFFGTSLYADAFRAGLRMPNAIQNLLGEGTLSASFIPVYSELVEEGRKEDAGRLAGAIFALLFGIAGALALLGILLAPLMVSIFLPGFVGERREITITIVRILFPMTGVLVLSAWALGILNSHRKFFVPYVAPVIWNGAMIATLLFFGVRLEQDGLAIALAWGALAGGALQFGIQLPWVLRLEPNLVATLGRKMGEVGEVVRNAIPAIMGRGVVQVSAYIDMVLASLLAIGGVAAIGYAQTLYMLPVSLFGMAVAAAELPELSRQRKAAAEVLRSRASAALRRMAFYVVASFVVFISLGDVVVAALYQTGEFGRAQTILVAATLAAYAFALMASTATRLYSSTYFALRDTKTPAMFATVRVGLAALLGFTLMVQFESVDIFGWTIGPGIFGDLVIMDGADPIFFGAVGLAAGTGVAAWVEWFLLRRVLRGRIGTVGAGGRALARLGGAAAIAAAVGWGVRIVLPVIHPIPYAALVLGVFGIVYVVVCYALGVEEAHAWVRRVRAVVARFSR